MHYIPKKKILIIDSVHQILIDKLNKSGFICDYQPGITLDNILINCTEYFGIILRSKIVINKTIIDSFKNIRFIGRVGSGMENIDIKYANSKGIYCFNSPEGNRNAVGEHALSMLLCLFNNTHIANNEVKNGIWLREKNRGIELKGKTIGIIGYGNTGKEFAKKISGFDVNVISFDKYKTNYSDKYTKAVSLEYIKNNADIISFHVPLSKETYYYFDNNFLNDVKKEIIIINTSRGKIINTSSLVKGLKSSKIFGACLDVHEYEGYSFENFFNQDLPADFKFLIDSENVILTPHIAGWTHESKYKLSDVLADKIINWHINL